MNQALWQTDIAGLPAPRRGKVRDVYDLGDRLLIVACDRLSAYDFVLETPIPDKGKILNQLTNFWFHRLADLVPHHLLATDPAASLPELAAAASVLDGRAVLARKADVIPFELVVRGYLAGSAYREYTRSGSACGHALAPDLERASPLPAPIFTPSTKATEGHDENVDFDHLVSAVGGELAERLRDLALDLYRRGAAIAAERGLILADTKFEAGWIDGELTLIDEALTPDSSRYWDAASWRPGEEPASYDKQFVRNWLDQSGWDHTSPPPPLPDEVVAGTRDRYLEAFRLLTGRDPDV